MFVLLMLARFFCFFFQAEDGIRGWSVTGVQTCALPILARHSYMNGAPPATLPGARIAHTDEWGRSQHSLSTATFLADENYGVRTGHGRNWVSPGPTLQKGTARTSGAFSSMCQTTPPDEFNLAPLCSWGETFR